MFFYFLYLDINKLSISSNYSSFYYFFLTVDLVVGLVDDVAVIFPSYLFNKISLIISFIIIGYFYYVEVFYFCYEFISYFYSSIFYSSVFYFTYYSLFS